VNTVLLLNFQPSPSSSTNLTFLLQGLQSLYPGFPMGRRLLASSVSVVLATFCDNQGSYCISPPISASPSASPVNSQALADSGSTLALVGGLLGGLLLLILVGIFLFCFLYKRSSNSGSNKDASTAGPVELTNLASSSVALSAQDRAALSKSLKEFDLSELFGPLSDRGINLNELRQFDSDSLDSLKRDLKLSYLLGTRLSRMIDSLKGGNHSRDSRQTDSLMLLEAPSTQSAVPMPVTRPNVTAGRSTVLEPEDDFVSVAPEDDFVSESHMLFLMNLYHRIMRKYNL
jgi:hypothetical protein